MWLLLLSALLQDTAPPLAVLDHPEAALENIRGDISKVPPGVTDQVYAAELAAAEGLKSWSGKPEEETGTGPMRYRAVHAGDGRQVVVYYAAGPAGRGTVCRLRSERGGMSEGWWQSWRWCARHFGITPPDRPGSPIATTTKPAD